MLDVIDNTKYSQLTLSSQHPHISNVRGPAILPSALFLAVLGCLFSVIGMNRVIKTSARMYPCLSGHTALGGPGPHCTGRAPGLCTRGQGGGRAGPGRRVRRPGVSCA